MEKGESTFGRFLTDPKGTHRSPAGLIEIRNVGDLPLPLQGKNKVIAKGEADQAGKDEKLDKREIKITIDETNGSKPNPKRAANNAEEISLTNADGKDVKPMPRRRRHSVPEPPDNLEPPQKGVSFQVTADDVIQAINYMEENDRSEYDNLGYIFEGRVRSARPKCHTTALSLTANGLALTCQQLHFFHVIHRIPTVIVVLICGVVLQLIAGNNARKQRNSTEYANCMIFGLFWGCFALMTMLPLLGVKQPNRIDRGIFIIAFTIYFLIYTGSAAAINAVQFFFGLSMLLGLLLTGVNRFTSENPVKIIDCAAIGYFILACGLSLYVLAHALLHSESTLLSLPLGRSLIDLIELF